MLLANLQYKTMKTLRFLLLFPLLLAFVGTSAQAQRTQLRGSQAHFGVALGVFTYHGRVDLNNARSSTNFTRSSDVAGILLGSFPIVRDRFFFRGMAGLTNLSALDTQGGLSNNEFLNRELFWFEPQIIYTLRRGSSSLFLPYVYTGFGTLIADPFGAPSGQVNQPNAGTPGPDRSVFTLPFGLGIDYPISHRFSVFADASYRINFNYVGRNEGNRNPHNSSLVMFGMRFNLAKIKRVAEEIPPAELPDPLVIPPYNPPLPAPDFPDDRCVLADLNTVFFDAGSAEVTGQTMALLAENVEALQLNPRCCARIIGHTDGADTEAEALKISRERAAFVFDFYTTEGIATDRLAMRERGTALSCLRKEDPECLVNRRVESVMVGCEAFPGQRQ